MPNVIIVNTPGPKGDKGDKGNPMPPREKRSDYSGSFSYCAFADLGSLETQNVWTITRITILQNGTVIIANAEDVNWTDRYTHIYI